MTWMILANGAEHHLIGGSALNNTEQSYSIDTIAHSLAQINRFTGHCSRPYSVAEHSLQVAHFAAIEGASDIVQLAALMHDAHESITGDVASPVKWTIGDPWLDFEHHQAAMLHNSHGLRTTMHSHRADLRRWDLIALATERRDLTAYQPGTSSPWPVIDNPTAPICPHDGTNLNELWRKTENWNGWRLRFIAQYNKLRNQVARSIPA